MRFWDFIATINSILVLQKIFEAFIADRVSWKTGGVAIRKLNISKVNN